MPTQLTVFENNDPQLDITLTKSDGSAYDLSNTDDIKFYLKNSPNDADAAAVNVYKKTSGDITFQTDGTDGAIFVQMLSTDIATPATMFYHLDAVDTTRVQTLMEGTLVVVNT